MELGNLVFKDIQTAATVAQTSNSSAILIDGCNGFCVASSYTVSTPVAKDMGTITLLSNQIAITAHGFTTGLKLQATTTTTLPAGLAVETDYFVIVVSAGVIKLASSLVNANAGTEIDITDAGTGTHTLTPVALAGCTVKLQGSIDNSVFFDLDDAVAITGTRVSAWNVQSPYYRFVRVVYTLTAGQLTVTDKICAKGLEG
jgi:hypothetical protein